MKTPPIQARAISKNYHPYTIINRSVEGLTVIAPLKKKLRAKYPLYREMVSIIDCTKINSQEQRRDIIDPSYLNKIEALQKDNRVHIQIKDPRHLKILEASRILRDPYKIGVHIEKIIKRSHIQRVDYDLKSAKSDKQIDSGLKQLIRVLRRGTVKSLTLRDKNFTDGRKYTEINSVYRALQRNHLFDLLSLTGFGARARSLYSFIKFLQRHKNLQELDLASFNIDSKGLRYISKSLSGDNNHLEALKINTSRYSSEFSIQAMEKFAETIRQHKSLKALEIDMPDLSEGRLALLATAIKNNPNIETVALSLSVFCRVSEVIPLLEDSMNLRELTINSITGDSSIQIITEALAKNKSITTLKLHLKAQQSSRKINTRLQLIDSLESKNRIIGYRSEYTHIPSITKKGLKSLIEMLSNNTILTTLNIYGDIDIENKELEDFIIKIRELLQRNNNLLMEKAIAKALVAET